MVNAFPRRSLFPVGPGEDPYSALLSGTRAIHREHRVLRESWLEELTLEHKDDVLFEFEVLLKATACFANPRNHPGPPRRATVVTQDQSAAPASTATGQAKMAAALAAPIVSPLQAEINRVVETRLVQAINAFDAFR